MEVFRTFSHDAIKAIVTHPGLWNDVSEDGHDPDNFSPEVFKECWLAFAHNDELVGVYQFIAKNKITLEVHPYILPRFRGKIAMQAGVKHLEWIYENNPNYMKLVGQVPVIYKHVKLYANMLGYKDEGLNRQSFLKNGAIHDQWILGITRKEIEGQLKWAA